MKKEIHGNPGFIIFVLIAIACISFFVYFSQHPLTVQTVSFLQPALTVKQEEKQLSATASGQLFYVSHVIDGDTIQVLVNGEKTVIRFIGVNAPETYQGKKSECFSEESFQYVKNRIEGESISLVADETQENKDKYERLLRYILLDDGTNLNFELIEKGYAREYTYKVPYQYQKEFRSAQELAKTNATGLWNACYK
ncbi:MAG: thermonuclease family protein [Microgenomates group bacterium]